MSAAHDDLIQKDDGEKVRDAFPSEWESIIASVKRETARRQSDLNGYYAAVKAGNRKADQEAERVFKEALIDHQTTERILDALYKRQLSAPPSV